MLQTVSGVRLNSFRKVITTNLDAGSCNFPSIDPISLNQGISCTVRLWLRPEAAVVRSESQRTAVHDEILGAPFEKTCTGLPNLTNKSRR